MGNAPSGYELRKSDAKRCVVVDERSSYLGPLTKKNIRVSRAEVVIYLRMIPHQQRQQRPEVKGVNTPLPSPDDVMRVFRIAALTESVFYLTVKEDFFSQSCACLPVLKNYDDAEVFPQIHIAFGEFAVINYDSEKSVVVISHRSPSSDQKRMERVMYQTPHPEGMLQPLLREILRSYVGTPTWAIPLKWNLPFLVPQLTSAEILLSYGTDGGFSKAFFYKVNAALARETSHPYHQKSFMSISSIQSKIASIEGQKYSKSGKTPLVLDVVRLGRNSNIIFAALLSLPFNLTFRTLYVRNVTLRKSPEVRLRELHSHLSKLIMYNVTLRELDLSGTKLTGAGQILGRAFATNIQPLISRLNLSNCQLSNEDFRALIPGLSRLWCCGSVDPVSLDISKNPLVSNASFQLFWKVLVHPPTLFCWPSQPPPPANTQFWQHLNIRSTQAHGEGLCMLLQKMTGLASFSLGPPVNDRDGGFVRTLETLSTSGAPLETFAAEGMDEACLDVLFQHHKTLRKVSLTNFSGSLPRLLNGWPDAVPRLALELDGACDKAQVPSHGALFAPGSIRVLTTNLNAPVTSILMSSATGLRELYLDGVFHSHMVDVAPILSSCGLEVLHLKMPSNKKHSLQDISQRACQCFWASMAISKTLRDLQVQNQLDESAVQNGLSLIGGFLKTNRSVRSIGFDGSFALELEDVKVLRSAFYGNKKVISMEYPRKAQDLAEARFRKECRRCTDEVAYCKREIKWLFKRAYSKYNYYWRDRPNREKIPYVDRIRVAKRKLAELDREMKKIGSLLDGIQYQIRQNRAEFSSVQSVKTAAKMEKKAATFSRIAEKKVKAVSKIATKLHKAKARGRKKKSAKQQIPRAAYYQDKSLWCPSNHKKRFYDDGDPPYWSPFNDPYNTRFTYWNGFYGNHHYYYHHHHHHIYPHRDDFVNNDDFVPLESTGLTDQDLSADQQEQIDQGVEVGLDSGAEVALDGNAGSQPFMAPHMAGLDIGVDDDDNTGGGFEGVARDPFMEEQATTDPWGSMDAIMGSDPTMTNITSILPDLHDEAAELGPDVLADIAPILDQVSALDSSVEQIAEAIGVEKDVADSVVDSHIVESGFDVGILQSTLGDVGDYDVGDDAMVDMYGAAGPRDLDDGGPAFGDHAGAVLARTHYLRRVRKKKREMGKLRKSLAAHPFGGYRHPVFQTSLPSEEKIPPHQPWPENLQTSWGETVQEAQIDILSKSEVFSFPEVSKPEEVVSWNPQSAGENRPFVVTLVTQCSLDRLENLEEQLAIWKGSACVALFVEDSGDKEKAKVLVRDCVERARVRAEESARGCPTWDVAVNLVQSSVPESPYPINVLRNVALLAAKEHHVNLGLGNNSAVFLVDVDFRPSENLNQTLSSADAADMIIKQKKVVVCPAFETKPAIQSPMRVSDLAEQIERNSAVGFHVPHFPQGHGPTDFTRFASVSSQLDGRKPQDCWKMAYEVPYSEGFEPYVVMATNSVPLYDERFQGYGLNKVTHLASVAQLAKGIFTVLPGVFISAPQHERSDSWSSIYGSSSVDAKFSRLCLKGLYRNFCTRLCDGEEVMVSSETRSWAERLRSMEPAPLVLKTDESRMLSLLDSVSSPTKNDIVSIYVCLLQELLSRHSLQTSADVHLEKEPFEVQVQLESVQLLSDSEAGSGDVSQ